MRISIANPILILISMGLAIIIIIIIYCQPHTYENWEVRQGKASNQTQSKHKKLPAKLRVAPKPIEGETADQNCFDLNLNQISFSHI